jgi:hypothetical protein
LNPLTSLPLIFQVPPLLSHVAPRITPMFSGRSSLW